MSKVHILVIDDEPSVRQMCVRTLCSRGYRVTETNSGAEAIAYLQDQTCDLLLTDLKMPGMGGLEVCRAVRRFDPELPIVIMTGYGTMESAIEALQVGASEFILKPFRPDELVIPIKHALDKRRLERENARLRALIPLVDLSRVFMSSVDLAVIPKHVVRIAQHETGADNASLMLLTEDGDLAIQAAEGLADEIVAHTRQPADSGIAGYAIAHREPVILQGDAGDDPRFSGHNAREIASAICQPLLYKDQVLGVLNVSRVTEGRPFTRADADLLAVLGSQAAVALENARLFGEIQRAYARLSELDHLKSEFINIASHELRAPLAVLLAYAGLLESQATGEMRDHLDQVLDSAMQLKSTIDEMVSLQRIDTGEAQVRLAEVDLTSVITRVVAEHKPSASRKGLTLVMMVAEDLPCVRADDQVVALVLASLVSNAIKFTPKGGRIELLAAQDGDRVTVAVRDNGVGIAAENLERIFDRFYQVEASLRREHGGIGLGLAIAREMADLSDGRISVESQIGEGSTFYLSLRKAE